MKLQKSLLIFMGMTCFAWTANAASCTAYCISEAEASNRFALYGRLEPSKIWILQRERQVEESAYLQYAYGKCDDLIQKYLTEKDKSVKTILVQTNEKGELIPATTSNSCR